MANVPATEAKGKGKATLERIKCLVEDEIQQHPFDFDGQMWAARSQRYWSAQAGVSVATFGRVISQPPFVRRGVQIDGKNVTLIRLGEDIKTALDYAKIMAKIWRDKTGRVVSRPEFGLICGLVDVWPEGQGPETLEDGARSVVGIHGRREDDRQGARSLLPSSVAARDSGQPRGRGRDGADGPPGEPAPDERAKVSDSIPRVSESISSRCIKLVNSVALPCSQGDEMNSSQGRDTGDARSLRSRDRSPPGEDP